MRTIRDGIPQQWTKGLPFWMASDTSPRLKRNGSTNACDARRGTEGEEDDGGKRELTRQVGSGERICEKEIERDLTLVDAVGARNGDLAGIQQLRIVPLI